MCYDAAAIVNRVLGVTGFSPNYYYWSSTEYVFNYAWNQYFPNNNQFNDNKSSAYYVRAVRIHNI